MKIVIVLCSLATFAIAVPVYQENVFESSLSNQASSTKRERKSAVPDIIPGLFAEHGIEKIPAHSSKKSGQGTSLEAKSFRRPIIIKRKLGYHVYRDSDEEMAYAEPGEKCREQVKFKLCDHEPVSSSKNGLKSPTFKCLNSHKTDNEMENSIKMAKEAVEHLQKDLKRMENFSAKMVNPHIEDIESNTGLHHDIEIAREALEHIENNFESVNLEVNKVNELQIPKSQDEERLNRWREAIENINKNYEIVKNIEDVFKSDNQLSLFRSDSIKADKSEEPQHSVDHIFVPHKLTNNHLENNDEVYNEHKMLKSASSEDGIVQLTSKTENVDNIGKDAGNDMFVSLTENREGKIQLHSDSLKSEIRYKDTSLRSDVSEIESTERDTNVPKESIEYARKNSNSLSESKNENNSVERQSMVPKSTIIENYKNSEAGGEEEKHSDKYNNKVIENKENKSKSYNTNMRLSNNQLEKTEQLSADNFDTIDQDVIQLPHLFSIKEKNVFSGEENVQNEHKTHDTIKESQEFYDSLKDSKQEVKDKAHNFKYTDEYKNIKSSEIQDEQISSRMNSNEHILNDRDQFAKQYSTREEMRMSQNRDANKDRKKQFSKSDPQLYSDPMLSMPTEIVDISDDQHSHKNQASMRLSQSQTENLQSNEYYEGAEHASTRFGIENSSDDPKTPFFKSVPELQPYSIAPLPTDNEDISNDQQSHGEEASMRSSENQNDKMQSKENQEVQESLLMGLDMERHPEEGTWQLSKAVPELPSDSMVSMLTEEVDTTDDQHAHKGDASMRSTENQNDKMQSNENPEMHEPLPVKLDIERHPEEPTSPLSKSVPELPYDSKESMLTEKVDITDDQHAHKGEASIRSTENQNDEMQSNENQEVHESLPVRLDIERRPEEPTWPLSKSVPELPYDSKESMLTEKVDNTDDQHAHKGEASMRSSENQNDKMQSNENQEVHESLPVRLDIERHPEEPTWPLSKSVPELPSDSMVSMLTEKVDITDNQHAHRGDAIMRLSENQNDKMQSNDNQEVHEPLAMGLDIERHPEERTWQYTKSVPELPYDRMVSMPSEKIDNSDDQQSHNGQANMRLSHTQNEKLQLKDYQKGPEHASTRLNIENNSDDTKKHFFKSVPELESHPIASFLLNKVETTNNRHLKGEEAFMRSAEGQNDKNQKGHHSLPIGLDTERHPEERAWQLSKTVPELPYDSMISLPMEKVDIIDDQHAHKGEASMRSSESQDEKLLLNKYQEDSEHASMILNIENNSDDTKTQFFKSVPELQPYPIASLSSDKADITNDQQSHEDEATMRLSENQNNKMHSNEYQEVHEPSPMGLDIERHPEERAWQLSKTVPELPSDSMVSMLTEEVDTTDDQHAHKGDASMRSTENQNDKMQSNENPEMHEPLPVKLDIERHPEEPTSPLSKSVPELPYDSKESMLTEKVDITDDQHAHKGGASIRSTENQNDKMQSNENQEVHESLPVRLDIERRPEEPTWPLSKSVPELPYDSKESMLTEKVDNTDDQHAHKGEASMRSSENQNDKMQSNENQEVHESLPVRLDIERHPEEPTWPLSKSVPELPSDSMVSMLTEKVDITDNQHAHRGDAIMRLSENQNDKMQSNENQEVHERLPMGLDIERHPEERTLQYAKSVPVLPYDPVISMATGKVDSTNDQYSYTGDDSMRVSETQNEKLQLIDNKEDPEHSSMRFDIENNVENQKSHFFKSVPELHSGPIVSLPTDKVEINNDQYSDKENTDMKLTQTQNEKFQLNEIQEAQEPLMMRLAMTNQPEDSKWQFSKSVPELPYDSMLSMPTDKVEIINEQSLNERNMRLSQNQNERTQFHKSHGLQDLFPTKLDIENHPEHSSSQFFKSVPELYMTRSNINHANNENFYFPEDARLSQNQNERQQIYFNQHLYEPLSSKSDNDKKLKDDSLNANKVRFSYIQNPMKEQTTKRLSQNENENKEIQYPRTSLGSSNEHMNKEDNAEYIMNNDFMNPSVAQHQQFLENHNSMLRSSNERQHLNHDFKSWPEYKMLPPTSQFEFRNGQNVLNKHTNIRINEQQSRYPEPMENQNLHNSLSMLWNTDNEHQDLSPKTFKSNSEFDHTLHKNNEFDNEQFIPHEVSKPGNTLEYRTRPQLFGDHILDDTQSSPWYQTKQHNDHFANYYKSIPEVHEQYMNPTFRKHLHKVAVNQKFNDADTFSSYDFPSSRLHDHMQKYHQEKSSNIDSSMESNMHMNMREPFAKSGTELNNVNFNHPHGSARFGAGLPIAGVNSGAVGVFPTANAGGCGIPLLLSCSPSVVSGSLARPQIAGPIFKSVDENFKYYMKRDAKNIADVPDIKIQKSSFPHHGTEATSEI